MQKRSCEEATGVPLQAAKLRRRETLPAAKDTLRHLFSADHVVTAEVMSEKHRGWLKEMISAVEDAVELLENTDKNSDAAPEEPLYLPTSPSYSPTSPKYDPCGGDPGDRWLHSDDEDAGGDEGLRSLDDDEPVYAVLIGPAAEPQRMDPVEVCTPKEGLKTGGILLGKDKGQGIVKFPNGDIGIYPMEDVHSAN